MTIMNSHYIVSYCKMTRKANISVTEFKAKCLEILREVNEDQVSYTITKHKKVVAEIIPPSRSSEINPLQNSILYEGDIISPTGDDWEAES